MNTHVSKLIKLGIINTEYTSIDSTPIFANTRYKNPKCFSKYKFNKSKQPKSYINRRLVIYSINNKDAPKNYIYLN